MSEKKRKGAILTGLDNFKASSFLEKPKDEAGNNSAIEAPSPLSGGLSYAPIERFHEDEENSRKKFNQAALEELAETLGETNPRTGKPKGIREPISVRPHPSIEGDFIINSGHRRYRAAGMVGLTEIPYFIEEDADAYDKVIVNIQREDLSPLETSLFIKSRLDKGDKPGEIAKKLGKQASYVSDHSIFFDLADCIRDLYDREQCLSMQALAMLHRIYRAYPDSVEEFCRSADGDVTTAMVRALSERLKSPKKKVLAGDEGQSQEDGQQESEHQEGTFEEPENSAASSEDLQSHEEEQLGLTIDGEPVSGGQLEAEADSLGVDEAEVLEAEANQLLKDDAKAEKIKKPIIQVLHDDRPARVISDRRVSYGRAWIKYDDDGHEVEVDFNTVTPVAITEGA